MRNNLAPNRCLVNSKLDHPASLRIRNNDIELRKKNKTHSPGFGPGPQFAFMIKLTDRITLQFPADLSQPLWIVGCAVESIVGLKQLIIAGGCRLGRSAEQIRNMVSA